jgi:hypothetical protein
MYAKTHKSKTRIKKHATYKITQKQTPNLSNEAIEINVLTYNLCWGCMSANEKSQYDRTAEYLALKCQRVHQQTGQHQCANNIINNIAMAFMENTNTGICDILALQEATNWQLVYDGLRKHTNAGRHGFANLGYINHLTRTDTGALAEMCTLYNRNRFRLTQVSTGDIGNGRPFQIIRLWWLEYHRELVIINIHNSHHGSANVIQSALGNPDTHNIFTNIPPNGCLDAGIWVPTRSSTRGNIPSSQNTIGTKTLILFMGDTNDHGNFKLWHGFQPLTTVLGLSNTKTTTSQLGKVSSQSRKPPVSSCCAPVSKSPHLRTRVNKEDFTYGDYILASDNLKYLKNNIIPTCGLNHNATLYPASDHLPILAIIRPR